MIRMDTKEPHRAPEGYAEHYARQPSQEELPPPDAPSCAPRGADEAFFVVQSFYDQRREPEKRFFCPDGTYPKGETF